MSSKVTDEINRRVNVKLSRGLLNRIYWLKGPAVSYEKWLRKIVEEKEAESSWSPPASNETGKITYQHNEEVIK